MNCKRAIESNGDGAKKGILNHAVVLMMVFVSKRLKQMYSLIMQ